MTIIASQKFRGLISPALRNNIHWLVLYRLPRAELLAVGEEYGEPLPPDDFAALADATFKAKAHNYMIIKTRQAGGSKFWDTINKPIEL